MRATNGLLEPGLLRLSYIFRATECASDILELSDNTIFLHLRQGHVAILCFANITDTLGLVNKDFHIQNC